MASCWRGPGLRCTKGLLTSPACWIGGLSGAFPRLCVGMHNRPVVDELVRCISSDLLITNIWTGDGELEFPEAYGEELDILAPLKVGRGFRFSFSYSVTDIEILADLS